MTELGIRCCLAGALTLASGWLGTPSTLVAWSMALLMAGLAVVRWRRPVDAAQAAWLATFDAAVISLVLADSGQLASLGWLTLIPLTDAVVRHRATGARLAAAFAGILLLAHIALVGGEPHWTLYLQIGGLYAMGLTLHRLRAERGIKPLDEPVVVDPDGLLALRENFRTLRDAYRSIEQRLQSEQLRSSLFACRLAPALQVPQKLAASLRDELNADGLLIARFVKGQRLQIVGAAGNLGFEPQSLLSLEIGRGHREALENTMLARLSDEVRSTLRYATWGNDDGVIIVNSAKPSQLLELAAPLVGEVVESSAQAANQLAQLQRIELLFALSRAARSSLGPESLAQRYVELVRQWFGFDHLSVHLVDPDGDRVLAFAGPSIWLVDHLHFPAGSGVLGWLTEGHPSLLQPNAAHDERLDRAEGLRQRIGKYFILPLRDASGCYGFLQGVNHETALPDGDALELLRRTLDELSFGLRMQGVRSAAWGSLVILEPTRQLEGRELELLGRRIQSLLPEGGVLRWHADGGFVALFPKVDDRFLNRWAQQLADAPLRVRVSESPAITTAVIRAERERIRASDSLVA